MGLHVVAVGLVDAHRVETAWVPRNVRRSWLELGGRVVPNGEPAVVVGDVLISVVSALAEPFLEAVAFVYKDWFEVAGAVHGFVSNWMEYGALTRSVGSR